MNEFTSLRRSWSRSFYAACGATMEPAAKQRDDHYANGDGYRRDHTLQWSPPLNGGTTG